MAEARASSPDEATAGHLLRLVRTGGARSRSDLVSLTGTSRSTVGLRVEQLLRAGLVVESGRGASTGGRPARLLDFRPDAGCVLGVDLDVTTADVVLTDLAGAVLGSQRRDLLVADGPEVVLHAVQDVGEQLLAEAGLERGDVRAIGVGLPGPVDVATGRPVHPPVMPGWHDCRVPEHFTRFGCPVFVDNDVNVMATGELSVGPADDFLVVKIGTGIGCAIVLDGRVYRGSDGSAGDIGHVHVDDPRHVVCSCGNEGCLEALAGGAALCRDAVRAGLEVASVSDLVALAVRSDPVALALVRESGRRVGEVLAGLVNFLNPSRIVITGAVADAGNPLLAGIREAVYRRSTPLAARDLDIALSALEHDAGQLGAARMAIEAFLAPERVDAALSPA